MDNDGDLLGGSDDGGFFAAPEEGPDLFGESTGPVQPLAPAKAASAKPVSAPPPEITAPGAPVAKPQSDGYVVLARKYRPQTFDDIVGQQGVQQGLRGAIATGQISHAYLFSGPRGTGKTSTARILAKALNCLDNGPRPDPCGRCASCRSITLGSSLDVIEIDAASNTGVDNIRELKSGVVLAPFSKYKVYIVDEVHMLSNQAFNALLKTLEEPPPQVIFVLATTELHKVPETIISRCQTFMFRRFSLEELKNQLGSILDIETEQRGLTVSPDDREKILDLVSRNAEGGMRDAQVTLDQVLVLSKGKLDFESVRRFLGMADMEALGSFVRLLHERKSRELLELIDTLVGQGQDLELFVKGVTEHLRDLLLVKCAGRDTSLINVSEDRALELDAVAKSLSAPFLVNTIDHFLKVVGEMKTSGQPRTVLELAVLKLTLVDASADLPNILKRLDALESGKAQAGSSGAATRAIDRSTAPEPTPLVAPASIAKTNTSDTLTSVVAEAPAHLNTSSEPIALKPTVSLSHLSDATSINEALAHRLKTENTMLSLSFEKACCGATLEGNTLVLSLDPVQKMAAQQVMRTQNVAIITKIVRELANPATAVKIELRENSAAPALETPSAVSAKSDAAPVASPVSNIASAPSTALEDVPPVISVEDESELKIYYPEEIREKTMVEVKAQEFEAMQNKDTKLKELVERTSQAFGIDSSKLKFHRSTLA